MNRKKAVNLVIGVMKTAALPLLVYVVFSLLTNGRSASSRMMLNTIRQSIVPMLLCWGLMITMSMGMMNFSCGAVMLSAGIIGGNLANMTNTGIWGLLLFCIALGVIIGASTGFLYNKLRVPCMVLTIGLMLFFEAFPRVFFSGGVRVPIAISALSMAPNCYIVAIIMLAIFYILYERTAFGHNIRALGASPSIAASVGLDADKMKFRAFVLAGFYFGVAAAVYVAANGEVRNVSSLGSMQTMMDSFMGMFLAMFMSQFCKMPIAVAVSTFTMKMMSNGFVALGMDATVRDLANGVFLLILLAISANAGLFDRIKADSKFQAEAKKEQQAMA